MSSRNKPFTVHPVLGGLNNTADPSSLDPNELTIADNILYLEGGQRKKRPGTAAYNSVAMVSTATNIRAITDFWRYGTSLTPVQNFISVAGSSIFQSTGGGAFTTLTVSSSFGASTNTTTNILVAGDFAVVSDGSSVPVAYDQTTLAVMGSTTLAGSVGLLTAPPTFTFGSYHLRRMFYAGLSTSPSRSQYTAAGNIMDSTGADTGAFMLNEGDGDQLLGISQPFHKRLYYFKGPQTGSVLELTGSTPSGFSVDKITAGAPLLNNKALITTPTDIYWLSSFGAHSLRATVQYGDTTQYFLSAPIQNTFRQDLRIGSLGQAWGFWHPSLNIIGWFVVPSGQTGNIWALIYNVALSDPTPGGRKLWSIWKFSALTAYSGAVMITPSGAATGPSRPRLYLGGIDGTVYAGDQTTLNDAGTAAYTARFKTGVLTRLGDDSQETREKSFMGVVSYFVPKGNYSAALDVTVDRRTQSQTFSQQGSGDTLA